RAAHADHQRQAVRQGRADQGGAVVKKALRKTSARRAERADKAKVRGGQGAEDVRASGGPFSLPDDVDFDAALHRAIMHVPPTPEPLRPVRAHVQPLLDYIKAKPLYHAHDRQKLAGLVRRLFRRIDELERKRGRPARESNKETPAHELAEGYAVQLVRLK